jgi:two-component system, NarL family, invasion response regulator UvrY
MIKVCITDDHELIREGFKKLIAREKDISIIGEAESGAETIEILAANQCDVVVLDINLPDKNGLEVLKDVKTRFPNIQILVLSMYPEERYAGRALKNGAAGYITKDSAPKEMIAAIRKIQRGGQYISEALAEQLASSYKGKWNAAPHENLSDREFEILLRLGKGKSVKDISEELNLSGNTVNTYKRRIFEKMGLKSKAELIQYVLRQDLTE